MKRKPKTPTGLEMIAKERQSQIKDHGKTVLNDVAKHSQPGGPFNMMPLLICATNCIGNVGGIPWPESMGKLPYAIVRKTYVERLAIAGAFIAAEIDRHQMAGAK